MTVMEKPVEDGCGDYRITQTFRPFRKDFIAHDYGAGSFISRRHKFEKQV